MNMDKVPEEIIRYISGNYTEEDKKFVEEWLAENSFAREELERLQWTWDKTGELQFETDLDRAWNNFSEKLKKDKESTSQDVSRIGRFPEKKVKSKVLGFLVRAAAVLLIAAGAYAFYQYNYINGQQQQSAREQVYHTLVSEEGEQIHFRFNDGSKVVLNGNSTVRYPSDFGSGTRELFLDGEAYFEVNRDHPQPFIVYAGNMRVTDISTKFNINAYPEGDYYEVTVSDGEVEVMASVGQSTPPDSIEQSARPQPVRITQGQKVEVDREEGEMVISRANLHASLGWLDNRLVFDGEPLSQIVARLERYYDIEIEVLDEQLLSQQVTASFQNERMENVFKVLSLSLDADYRINQTRVELFLEPETD